MNASLKFPRSASGAKHLAILLVLGLAAGCFTARSGAPSPDQQPLIDRRAERLQVLTTWAVENGLEVHGRAGTEGVMARARPEGFNGEVNLHGDRKVPQVHLSSYGGGMSTDIWCLHRSVEGGVIYEYWSARSVGKEWIQSPVKLDRFADFFVTRTDRVDGVRQILHRSRTFFPSYRVSDEVVVALPLDSLRTWASLRAWEFPDSFPDSELRNWMTMGHPELGTTRIHLPLPARRPGSIPGFGVALSAGEQELGQRLGGSERSSREALERVLGQSEGASFRVLESASRAAFRLGRMEDAGFLFYAAYLRVLLDEGMFPRTDPTQRMSPAGAQLWLGGAEEPDLMRRPRLLAPVIQRLGSWTPRASADYTPGWAHAGRRDEPAARVEFESARTRLLAELGRAGQLLQDRAYFQAFDAMPYNAPFLAMNHWRSPRDAGIRSRNSASSRCWRGSMAGR